MHYYGRTVGCELINSTFERQEVQLAGWVHRRRDHGNLIFIDLRDRSGIIQLVFGREYGQQAHELAHMLRSEYVIQVSGVIVPRQQETINLELTTGKWEVQVKSLHIINKAKGLPFQLNEAEQVDEELRLKYRYLDLRRLSMQKRFSLRNNASFIIRSFFHERGFYEIETPLLTKNTPEGAREFLVPSRHHKGSFYALPQSPQLYKQLLMASGMEKYFQLAHCFRDEDLRADRQPEFTQLDLEMSFVKEKDVQELIEQLIQQLFQSLLNKKLDTPFIHIDYEDAIAQYGSDKPDIRFGLEIKDISSVFHDTSLNFLKNILGKNGRIGALLVDQQEFSRSELDRWVTYAQQLGAKGLLWIKYCQDGKIESPVSKFLPSDFIKRIEEIASFKQGNTLFIIAGAYFDAWELLGRLRVKLAESLNLVSKDMWSFAWITNFPLFEYDKQTAKHTAVHHPFTAPQEGWERLKPDKIKARAYDLVLNGVELGGGSIRIHDYETQKEVFNLLSLSQENIQEKFGFLLEAQQFGFPPYGGFALGLDRLIMLLAQVRTIRDVIAFPKTASGYDPLMQAPTPVGKVQLAEYNLKLTDNDAS